MRCCGPRIGNEGPRTTRRRELLRAALEECAEPLLADDLHQAVRENLARTYRTLGDPWRRDVHDMIQREGSPRRLCELRCHQTIRATVQLYDSVTEKSRRPDHENFL